MKRVVFLSLLVFVTLFAIRSPLGVSAAPTASYTIEMNDSGFVVADELAGGVVTLTFTNAGATPGIPIFTRLKDGETPESFAAAGPAALALIENLATVGFLPPGMSDSLIVDLKPGTWLVMDQINPATPPVFTTVVAGAGDGTEVPTDAPVIGMYNFAFTGIATTQTPGKVTWKMENKGTQPHEVALYQIETGVTPETFLASFDGNSPPAGIPFGTAATTPGDAIWKEFNLTPGNYIVVCFIPDEESGAPHAQLGMMTTFTVADAPATMPQTGSATPWYLTWLGWGAVMLIAVLTIRAVVFKATTR